MRIRIDHSTRYAYARPARFIVQMLRLTPKSCESQQVRDWRIETDVDARLRRSEDAFGNPSREVRKSNHEATLIPKDGCKPCIARVGTKLCHFKEALCGFGSLAKAITHLIRNCANRGGTLRRTETTIDPPSGVNLMALEIRLRRMRSTTSGSA